MEKKNKGKEGWKEKRRVGRLGWRKERREEGQGRIGMKERKEGMNRRRRGM